MPSPVRIGVCLILGCLTTLVVAWVLAVRVVVPVSPGPVTPDLGMYLGVDGGYWWYTVQRRPGLTVVVRERGRRVGVIADYDRIVPSIRFPWHGHEVPVPMPFVTTAQIGPVNDIPAWARQPRLDPAAAIPVVTAASARGWPCRAVWYEATMSRTTRVNNGGIDLPQSFRDLGPGPVLPLRVIPVGLAVDAALYGSAWMLLLAVPGLVRRVTRHHQGQCVECGYDLRHVVHNRCPECGGATWGDERSLHPLGWRVWGNRSTSH